LQFIDLNVQQSLIKKQIGLNLEKVFGHGRYIMGPEVAELESELSKFVGVEFAIGCSSGTDALLMALMAYNVGPGDIILTSPFTFIATAEVISLLGAKPVFVDIDPITFNIDPVKIDNAVSKTLSAGSEKPAGIIAVDLFGLPADYENINLIADKHDLFVIEDAAQSFGASYKGQQSGSLGDIACTSFFPAKPLGCYGDGGMCFTDDAHLAEILQSIRVHGKGTHKYDNARIGINGRLDTIQAAILNAKFDLFPNEIRLRQKVAHRYHELLGSVPDIILPSVPKRYQSVWAQYSILAKSREHREHLQSRLKENDIPTAIYYPKPLHLQTAYRSLGYEAGSFPISEEYAQRIFSIPMHPYLHEKDQAEIAKALIAA
jgi:dTDP-4-amino-4,6-dideoxygalactose transaminase